MIETLRNVVVVGGSYVGMAAAKELAILLPKTHRVLLVEPHSHFHHLFAFPRFAIVPNQEHKAFIPYTAVFAGTPDPARHAVVKAKAVSLYPQKLVLDGAWQGSKEVRFEYLVAATGTRLAPPGTMDSDEKVPSVAYLQQYQQGIKQANSVTIIGGGAVGVQMACDLKEVYPEKEITLVHSRDTLMPVYHPALSSIIKARFSELGVKLITGVRVRVPSSGFPHTGERCFTLELQDGRTLATDFAIVATGQKPNSQFLRTLEPDAAAVLNPANGFIRVRPTGQFQDRRYSHLFAAGDIADSGAHKAARPGVAQAAVVAKNIAAMIEGKEPGEKVEVGPAAIHLTLGLVKNLIFANPDTKNGATEPFLKWRDDGRQDMGIEDVWKRREEAPAPVALQSNDHRDLLDTIDKLRQQGITNSVLEAISGLSFPTKDNLCTRFATELILRRSPGSSIKICILPGHDRSESEKAALATFTRTPATMDLGDVIEEAKTAMGLSDTKVFSTDILRVELSGPKQPHLTMVDLPGLFMAGNKDQTAEDAALVKKLVSGYMDKPRSIILAVVSAKSDFALQQVTELTREVDAQGVRTLGIITKPDTLDEGSDSELAYVELAQNKDVVFRLGWHVLRNRGYAERNCTHAERDDKEAAFFAQGVWKTLKPFQVGVTALRSRLSHVLVDQIMLQLPSVLEDVASGIAACESTLGKLGEPRGTPREQRMYLTKISQEFSELAKEAIDGSYTATLFSDADGSGGYECRLRAVVQNTLQLFEDKMRAKGKAREITDEGSRGTVPSTDDPKPDLVSRKDYLDEVKKLMEQNRGRELPGSFNPLIVSNLFSQQCRPWKGIVAEFTDKIFECAQTAIQKILGHIADQETSQAIFRLLVGPSLRTLKRDLMEKTAEIVRPHLDGHPITYNHYLTETIQKKQSERLRKALEKQLACISDRMKYEDVTPEQIMEAIHPVTEPDMNTYSANMATDVMEAYYKVARKTVVDNIAQLAVEQCLIKKLPGLFCPAVIAALDDAEVRRIAEESPEAEVERAQAETQLEVLRAGQLALEHLRTRCPSGLMENDADAEL
ncbi:hypothetical protein P8C59_001056 [Phyllachora maydis]|uniref:GED domain-containing protein n=1 Tax=Phyllachora maydis TaxID=1825666 RepID=A0AAD9HXL9_9PEZI|nr:hypothetical protein P8C59_001056 [Phyllachora maydis]